MKFRFFVAAIALFSFGLGPRVPAQSSSATPTADAAQLEILTRKIDEQNTKIDALSQQLLKLEQEVAQPKALPTVAETATTPPVTAIAPPSSPSPSAASGTTHVVARGETLTSIAKLHKVSIEELQKTNHIEDDRKLRIGQILTLPAASPAPSTTPEP